MPLQGVRMSVRFTCGSANVASVLIRTPELRRLRRVRNTVATRRRRLQGVTLIATHWRMPHVGEASV